MDYQSLSTVLNKKAICIFAKLEEDVMSLDEYMFDDAYTLWKTIMLCSYTRLLR